MKLKKIYFVESVISMLLGTFLLLTAQIQTLGAVINLENMSRNSSVLWGSFFLICGVALFIIVKVKE